MTSQTTTAARTDKAAAGSSAGGPGVPGAVATRAGRALGLTPGGGATTPRRLGLARLVAVGLSLLIGIGSVVTAVQLYERQGQAEVHAAQYVRSTAIETELLSAQAAAARASLSGASAQVNAAHTALDEAATLLVEVAAEGTDEAADLAGISHNLLRYTETLERAQLQRGTKAGQTALGSADDLLRTKLLPAVQDVQQSHAAVSTSPVSWWMWLLPVLAWVTAATLLGVSWYTARVSHRVVNLGLAIATLASVVVAVTSGNILAGHGAGTAGSVGGQFSQVDQLTQAQRSAVDAFALLATGTATQSWSAGDKAEYTDRLAAADEALEDSSATRASSTLDAFRSASGKTVAALDEKDWATAAAQLARTSGEYPAPTAAAFLDEVGSSIDAALADLRAAVRALGLQTVGFAIIAVICAILAGLASALGLHQRLKEYR